MNKAEALNLWKDLELPWEPVDLGEGLWGKVIEWTVDRCKVILEKYNEWNRLKKWVSIHCYADDIKNNRWLLTHQAIGFGEGKELFDGQNRLEAIIEAEIPVKILTIIGMTKRSRYAVDENTPRTGFDVSKIKNPDSIITKGDISVAKMLERGYENFGKRMSNTLSLEVVREFEPIINWINKNLPRKTHVTTAAGVRAAIGRCYITIQTNSQKIGLLKNCCSILVDPSAAIKLSEENPVVYQRIYQNTFKLRDHLISGKNYWGQMRNLYFLVEYILSKILAGELVQRFPSPKTLRSIGQELFPFEDEELAEEAE